MQTYSNIKKERIEAKHNGNKVKNETLKLALNAVTGLMQNEFSWMYSPNDVMKIRMNGQLFLLKLAELFYKYIPDCHIFNWNTDGLFIKYKKKYSSQFEQAVKEFEQLSLLTMEADEFESMFQMAVNDYIAVKAGYSNTVSQFKSGIPVIRNKKDQSHYTQINEIDSDFVKQKGMFIDKVTLGKGMQPMIIPHALNEYFIKGIPVEKTIKECKDLNQFVTYQKVSKDYSVEYNEKLVSHINRYYVSTNGYYLFKCKVDKNGKRSNFINMLKGFGVKIVNNFDEITSFPTDINYSYYIKECYKIIASFQNKQLSLF